MSLKERLVNGEILTGTWVKTPDPIVSEVLAYSDIDVLCLDAEHAPFGRRELDTCLMALKGRKKDGLVRVSDTSPATILSALDSGATGIIAPHIKNADDAHHLVKACLYGEEGRGFACTTRAGEFGETEMVSHIEHSNKNIVVVAQIEDPEALDNLDEIAAVGGIDCLFIGRIDLTVAFGVERADDPRVMAAVKKICEVGRKHGKSIGMFTPYFNEIEEWVKLGCNLFILSSDHAFLKAGANALHQRIVDLA